MDSKTRAELIQYVDRQLDYVNVQLKLSPDSIQERAVAIVDHIVAAMQPSETDADLTLAYLAGVERGGDLDALLASIKDIHPEARLQEVFFGDPRDCQEGVVAEEGYIAEVRIPYREGWDGKPPYMRSVGTGDSVTAAIKDAIRKAKEAQQ